MVDPFTEAWDRWRHLALWSVLDGSVRQPLAMMRFGSLAGLPATMLDGCSRVSGLVPCWQGWLLTAGRRSAHRPRAASPSAAERATVRGSVTDGPFVIVAQPTVADSTRAPQGRSVVWAYRHVPNGWDGQAAPAGIEKQLDRFARDGVISSSIGR